MHPTPDSRQIQYLTRNYERLQGLRFVPGGLAALAGGLLTAVWPLALPFAILALALAQWMGKRRVEDYYQSAFGAVRPSGSLPLMERYLTGVGNVPARIRVAFGSLFVLVGLVTAFLNWHPYAPLAVVALACPVAIIVYLRRHGDLRRRAYWVVGAGLLIAASLLLLLPLPVLHRFDTLDGFARLVGLYLALMGLVLTGCGLLDHRILVRSFRSVATVGHAATL